MKHIAFTIAILFCTNAYCHNTEWVPANTGIVLPPVVETTTVPAITYTTYMTPSYQWVPVYVNKPTIINNYGIFIKRQQIIYTTHIEWVLVPAYR